MWYLAAMSKKKQTIGRADCIDLPEFSLENIPVKVDTGAYTSALHCEEVQVVKENGERYLEFRIPALHKKGKPDQTFRTSNFRRKSIRSSNGNMEKRYIITTYVRIFGRRIKTEFSLSDRSKMRYPILLGRKLLGGRFIVDVSKKDLSFKAKSTPS